MRPAHPATTAIPETDRSRRAIARVRPSLQRDLASIGAVLGAPLYLRAFKREATLEAWVLVQGRYQLFRSYGVCAQSGTEGPKQREGDQQVPEGFYAIGRHGMNPSSQFHLSMNVGYPNRLDRSLGRTGALIMIHGDCVSIGCLAMTDPNIEQIYALAHTALAAGQSEIPVHVFPFRLTSSNLRAERASEWYPFWSDLALIDASFARTALPPRIKVSRGRYQLA